ncbi:MAG: peptide deformylase [Verrucomicrobia bacterium]|nr:peptide deformylase [Verrucomicrobiota bacterium]
MILPIVNYGHPALRQKGARVESVTAELRQLIDDMLETMYAAAGIGLAAQQVGRALELTVIDVRAATDRPSTLERDGKPADIGAFMPLVLINPALRPHGEPDTGPEGCLSFPGIYADITRPARVDVVTTTPGGERIEFSAGGLLSRVVQHEVDHLNGILFIDRMTRSVKAGLQPELDALQQATKAALKAR